MGRTLHLASLAFALGLSAAPHGHAVPTADEAGLAAIRAATGGTMTAAQGTLQDPTCGAVPYEAEAVDLNGDGQPEVMTKEHGGCFGMAGMRMNLYIKGRDGRWVPQFGFPGMPMVRSTRSHGFPDIEVGGPGQCFPVWRYDGRRYKLQERCR